MRGIQNDMRLTRTQLKNRIRAAAALHGWTLKTLSAKLDGYGADKHLVGAIAGGSKHHRRDAQRADYRALSDVLDVPEEWFTVADYRDLLCTADGHDYIAASQAEDAANAGLEAAASGLEADAASDEPPKRSGRGQSRTAPRQKPRQRP